MRSSASEHRHELLLSLPKVQLERLSYIDFRLYFLGDLRRIDLTDRFGTGPAGASRDIAMYRQVAPENLEFDGTGKYYVTPPAFTPVFDHAPQRVLTALSQRLRRGRGRGQSRAARPLRGACGPQPSEHGHPRAHHAGDSSQAGCPVGLSLDDQRQGRTRNRAPRACRQRGALACPGLRPEVGGVSRLRVHPDGAARDRRRAGREARNGRPRHGVEPHPRFGVRPPPKA